MTDTAQLEEKLNTLRTKVCTWEKAHGEKHELEKEIVRTERANIKTALDLQAAENSRRLDILNGEADRLHAMQTTYLPRELYEAAHKEVVRRLDGAIVKDDFVSTRKEIFAQVDRLLIEVEHLKIVEANLRGQVVAYSASIGIALSVITFILNKVLK